MGCVLHLINPYWIKPEDRIFLSEEQLKGPSFANGEKKTW
jgi:hypothetical protein